MKKQIIVLVTVIIIIVVVVGLFMFISKVNTSAPDESSSTLQEIYSFKENETEIKVGDNFLTLGLPETSNVYEAESCAFDGIEKTYTYENYEITTCVNENSENILTIYLTTDQVSTKEGIKIGDSVDAMKQAYGENFELTDFSYVYKKGNSTLTFIIDNDIITSIEYS